MEPLCRLFGKSKQAYYKYDEDALLKRLAEQDFAIQFIKEIRKKDPGLSGKKLWYMYSKELGEVCPIGRDRFASIVDEFGFKVRLRVRAPQTTDSTHGLPTYPNLVKDFIPTAPNTLWVSDITYITIWLDEYHYAFCYLSLVLDAYTEEIVGWSIGDTLETAYPLEALRMALERLKGAEEVNLIHHSDRGCQYASKEYVALLASHGIRISMTESGDPKDNAQAERINNTMKNELLRDMRFVSIEQVREAVSKAVVFYNEERPHMSINMMTPREAAGCTGEIGKLWRSRRAEAVKQKKASALLIPDPGLPCTRSPSGLRPPVNPVQG